MTELVANMIGRQPSMSLPGRPAGISPAAGAAALVEGEPVAVFDPATGEQSAAGDGQLAGEPTRVVARPANEPSEPSEPARPRARNSANPPDSDDTVNAPAPSPADADASSPPDAATDFDSLLKGELSAGETAIDDAASADPDRGGDEAEPAAADSSSQVSLLVASLLGLAPSLPPAPVSRSAGPADGPVRSDVNNVTQQVTDAVRAILTSSAGGSSPGAQREIPHDSESGVSAAVQSAPSLESEIAGEPTVGVETAPPQSATSAELEIANDSESGATAAPQTAPRPELEISTDSQIAVEPATLQSAQTAESEIASNPETGVIAAALQSPPRAESQIANNSETGVEPAVLQVMPSPESKIQGDSESGVKAAALQSAPSAEADIATASQRGVRVVSLQDVLSPESEMPTDCQSGVRAATLQSLPSPESKIPGDHKGGVIAAASDGAVPVDAESQAQSRVDQTADGNPTAPPGSPARPDAPPPRFIRPQAGHAPARQSQPPAEQRPEQSGESHPLDRVGIRIEPLPPGRAAEIWRDRVAPAGWPDGLAESPAAPASPADASAAPSANPAAPDTGGKVAAASLPSAVAASAGDLLDFDAPGNATRIIRAVAAQLQGRSSGTIRLQLDPPGLGQVRIDLAMDRDSVRVTLLPASESAAQLLGGRLHELRDSLSGRGLSVGSLTVQSPARLAEPVGGRQGQAFDQQGQSRQDFNQQQPDHRRQDDGRRFWPDGPPAADIEQGNEVTIGRPRGTYRVDRSLDLVG